jgi:[ribosomal protein S5]-alanine N-acetyltransferase
VINYLGTPKIDTNRLLLRKLEITDTQNMYDHWLSDDRVTDNRVNAAHKSVKETYDRIYKIVSKYNDLDFCYWGIELKDSGELIGEIDLYDFDSTTDNCQVSYSLGYNWWNRGYGTEALKAVIEFGFTYMNIHKISAAHNTDNPASGRIMSKVGMEREGIIRHMIRNSKHQYKDCAVCGILQKDYMEMNNTEQTTIIKLNDKPPNNIMNAIAQLLNAFKLTWSLKSSSKWTIDNPAKGQCGVTSLVVQDILGGEIHKTSTFEGWHYYNVIQNRRYDFTESQFSKSVDYEDIPSNREEALLDTNLEQYNYLKNSVLVELNKYKQESF